MSIINRYILKEFFKYFSIILILVISLQLAVDFLNSIDRFMKVEASLYTGFIYVVLKIPKSVALLTPVAGIISISITFGLLNRNNELVALRSSGASLSMIMKPALIIGVFLTLFFFLLTEQVVSQCQNIANNMQRSKFGKKDLVITDQFDIWKTSNNLITSIRLYSPKKGMMKGITVYYFNDDFQMQKRVDAQTGRFEENQWILNGVTEQVLDQKTHEYKINKYAQQACDINITPEDLKSIVKLSEEMNLIDLNRYINKLSEQGYDAGVFMVDFQDKIAFPFVGFLLSIIGAGISIRSGMKSKIIICVASGLGVSFLYWFVRGFFLSMGYSGVFPPVVAAWCANLLFSIVAYITYVHAD